MLASSVTSDSDFTDYFIVAAINNMPITIAAHTTAAITAMTRAPIGLEAPENFRAFRPAGS